MTFSENLYNFFNKNLHSFIKAVNDKNLSKTRDVEEKLDPSFHINNNFIMGDQNYLKLLIKKILKINLDIIKSEFEQLVVLWYLLL